MDQVLWWTANGYTRQAPPEAFSQMQARAASLAEGGYQQTAKAAGDEHSPLRVAHHRHAQGHRMISISNEEEVLSRIFVAPEDADQFFATEYLVILGRHSAIAQGRAQELLSKTVLAFVRHGQSTHTISEQGQTKDEAKLEQERQTMRRLVRNPRPPAAGE